MKRYSILGLLKGAAIGHRCWEQAWRSPDLRSSYDVVIIGAGGHGLATAYYLAKKHRVGRIAVVEKGYLGGGNVGRNTQATRSNYYWPQSAAFFDHSLRLFEGLAEELNFNVMLSQRGILTLAHSDHELDSLRRWVNAILISDVDSRMLSPAEIRKIAPLLRLDGRYPIHGGFIQPRAGTSRHDAVAWGYARAASALGVDIIQQCEVTGITVKGNRVRGVTTTRGVVEADKVMMAVAGHTSQVAGFVGLQLPIVSMTLQACVTEPVKPCLDTIVLSPVLHTYLSQSDRGEIVLGGACDVYTSYSQRGGVAVLQDTVAAVTEMFPSFGRLRVMRQWGGVVDITPDTTPILGLTPIENLFISGGWGTGGYKAIPAGGDTMAYTVANGVSHPLIVDFGLDRFARGALIDEGAASGVAH